MAEGMPEPDDVLYPPQRLRQAQQAVAAADIDALLLTPGADLRYLTGYAALPLERLTCLVVPADGEPALIVPELEHPRAVASPAGALGIEVLAWPETADPYQLAASRLASGIRRVALANRMWVEQALRLRFALPEAEQTLATDLLGPLRIRKSSAEVAAIRRAGQAIDRVHQRLGELRWVGRREVEIGRDIAELIVAEGHAQTNFVIVGSGPNGASPHHDTGERVVGYGDAVVVDIGGTTADGYCSDSTRTYVIGDAPDAEFTHYYDVLQAAQEAACAAVRPGVSAESVDAAARYVITEAGYGERFVHRTGHGIGLEEHEDPYLVAGNPEPLEPGMCFSIEPGIYLPRRHGARIEDIVTVTADGVERLNVIDRDLVTLAG